MVIGDRTWTDYEVEVSIRIGAPSPDADAAPSNGPGVGLALRWTGHNDSLWPGYQPSSGFVAQGSDSVFGALLFWRDQRTRTPAFELYDEHGAVVESAAPFSMSPGVDYVFKAQVEGSQPTTYRWKVWRQDQAEPQEWMIEHQTVGWASDAGAGSVALIAHEIDASFGTVYVRPL